VSLGACMYVGIRPYVAKSSVFQCEK